MSERVVVPFRFGAEVKLLPFMLCKRPVAPFHMETHCCHREVFVQYGKKRSRLMVAAGGQAPLD